MPEQTHNTQSPYEHEPYSSHSLLAPMEEEGGEEDERGWLLTYADMVTLLLTFFVMLVAMSHMSTERFQQIIRSLKLTLGAQATEPGALGKAGEYGAYRWEIRKLKLFDHTPLLIDLHKAFKGSKDVEIETQGRKVILRVKGKVLFATGSADLNPAAIPVLKRIAKIVKEHPEYRLDIKGHTDPRPIHTAKFASNWELSALRATTVLRFMLSQGIDPHRMTATGYADTEPLVPNTSEENMARNRRVEFVLEKMEE